MKVGELMVVSDDYRVIGVSADVMTPVLTEAYLLLFSH